MSEYKPNISKIKIHRLKTWIEDRLTDLLDGLEDEILWGMVYNFLEDAQKRAVKEGPEVNPSGGLDRRAITEALLGFLGQVKAAKFVQELFEKLKEAEMTDEALEIISTARKPEKSLSERVEREIRQADSRGRDYRSEYRNGHDRRSDRDGRSERDRRSESDGYESRDKYHRYRNREYNERDRYESSSRSKDSHERSRDRDSYKRSRDRDSYEISRERDSYESSRDRRDSRDSRSYQSSRDSHSRSHRSRSRPSHSQSSSGIPSSNSPPRRAGSISPVPVRHLKASPGLERTREPSWEKETAPVVKAPQVKETVPSALEAALRERAKKSRNL